MNKIHLIGGEKGGVGKSVVARVVAQYLIDKNIPFLGFDTDRSHGSLLRFYADFASPIVVDNYESLDAIVEAAAEQADKRVLVDLAAQTHDPLVKWMDDSGVLETAEELGVAFNYWHVMDNGKDSVDLLKKLFDRFGPRLNYVIILNQLRGENFEIFDQSGERERALALHARIITLKRLHEPVINKIDAGSTSFWAAKTAAAPTSKVWDFWNASASNSGCAAPTSRLTRSKFEPPREKNCRSWWLHQERQASNGRLFFLAGGGFRGDGGAFLGVGAARFGFLLTGLLLVGFRGFIAHNFFIFLLRLTGRRHESFSGGNPILLICRMNVNDGREIICRRARGGFRRDR